MKKAAHDDFVRYDKGRDQYAQTGQHGGCFCDSAQKTIEYEKYFHSWDHAEIDCVAIASFRWQ